MDKQKSSSQKPPVRNCDFCHLVYQPKKSWQRFCSKTCHDRHWIARRGESGDRFKRIEQRLDSLEERIKKLEEEK